MSDFITAQFTSSYSSLPEHPEMFHVVCAACTLTNCQVGLNVHEGICVVLKNNDISFNEVGLIFDGYGIIQENKMWGNLHKSTIDLGKEALARAKVLPCMWLQT